MQQFVTTLIQRNATQLTLDLGFPIYSQELTRMDRSLAS